MESLLCGCPGHHPAQRMWRGLFLAELELTSHGQNSQEQWVTLQCPLLPAGGSLSMPAAMQPCSPKKGRGRGAEDARMWMGLGNTCMFDWRMPYKITLHNTGPIAAIGHFVIWSCILEGFFTHSTTISEVSTMSTSVNEQLCSLLLWSLQSTSLCFSLPLSIAISNTDSEKDRGLLKKLLCTLGGPDRLVAGKIPYYTEYKTWDKISDLENPPFHGGVGWN